MTQQGRFWRIENGVIQNDADISNIQPPYKALIQDAIATFTRHIPNDIHSIYITGSIPRGTAIESQSDLDMFAILESQLEPELVMQDWIDEEEDALLDKYDCVSDVQLELWPYGYVFRDPAEFSVGAFIIKTHSVCLWGSNVMTQLPDYTVPDAFVAIANDDVIQIHEDIDEAMEDIEYDSSPNNVFYWSKRISKNILRAGFGFVMPKVQKHTRDVDLCYAAFSESYPDQAKLMQQALNYTKNPTENADEILTYLNTFGSWMIHEADKWLDKYNPDHHLEYQFEPMDED